MRQYFRQSIGGEVWQAIFDNPLADINLVRLRTIMLLLLPTCPKSPLNRKQTPAKTAKIQMPETVLKIDNRFATAPSWCSGNISSSHLGATGSIPVLGTPFAKLHAHGPIVRANIDLERTDFLELVFAHLRIIKTFHRASKRVKYLERTQKK